jgi:transposase
MSRPRKLDRTAEERVIQLRAMGLRSRQIAERFGVHVTVIRRTINKFLARDEPEPSEPNNDSKPRRGSAPKGSEREREG